MTRLTTPIRAHGTSSSTPDSHADTELFLSGVAPPLSFFFFFFKTVPLAFGVKQTESVCWTPVGLVPVVLGLGQMRQHCHISHAPLWYLDV